MNCTDIKKTRRAIWYNEEAPLNNYDIWLERTNEDFVLRVYDDDRWYTISTSDGQYSGNIQTIQWTNITGKPYFATINGIPIVNNTEQPEFIIPDIDNNFTLKGVGFNTSGIRLGQITLLHDNTYVSGVDITIPTSYEINNDTKVSVPTTGAVYNALQHKQDLLPNGRIGQILTYTQNGPQWQYGASGQIYHISGKNITFSTSHNTASSIYELNDGCIYVCDLDIDRIWFDPNITLIKGSIIKFHTTTAHTIVELNTIPFISSVHMAYDIIDLSNSTVIRHPDQDETVVELDVDTTYYIHVIGNALIISKVTEGLVQNNVTPDQGDICVWFGSAIAQDIRWVDSVIAAIGHETIPRWMSADVFSTDADALTYYNSLDVYTNDIEPLQVHDDKHTTLYFMVPDVYKIGIYVTNSMKPNVITQEHFEYFDETTINNIHYNVYSRPGMNFQNVIPYIISNN